MRGTGNLSRNFCRTCRDETLHKVGVCVHCGTEQPWRAKRERLSIRSARCRGIYGLTDKRLAR